MCVCLDGLHNPFSSMGQLKLIANAQGLLLYIPLNQVPVFAQAWTVTEAERKAKKDGKPKLPLIDLVTKKIQLVQFRRERENSTQHQIRQNSSTERKRRTRFVASQISFSNLHSHFIHSHFINSNLLSFFFSPFQRKNFPSSFYDSLPIHCHEKRKLQSRSLSGFRARIGFYKWIFVAPHYNVATDSSFSYEIAIILTSWLGLHLDSYSLCSS